MGFSFISSGNNNKYVKYNLSVSHYKRYSMMGRCPYKTGTLFTNSWQHFSANANFKYTYLYCHPNNIEENDNKC